MTPELDRALVDLVIDTPESTAKEHYEAFCAMHNLDIHYSTICKSLHRLGFSCKRLRGYARERDERAALKFKAYIVSTFSPEQLFFLDETAKDPRAINRNFGWAMRGKTPMHSSGMIGRGRRHSALCGFDVKGFVNWYITKGTFNRTRFLDAFKATVVSAVYQRHPCCPRRCCGGRDSPTLFDARSCRTPNPSRASVPSSSWTTPPSIIALSSSHYVTRRALFFCTRHPTASTAHPWTMERSGSKVRSDR